VRQRATSLWRELGVLIDREFALEQLLRRIGERQTDWTDGRHSPAGAYARYVETLGRQVEIEAGQSVIRGRAIRIEDDGRLIVATKQGEVAARFGDLLRQV